MRTRPLRFNAGRIGTRAAIERYYAAHPDATQEQVRLATGASRTAVRKTFDAMVLAGRIVRRKAMVLVPCDES